MCFVFQLMKYLSKRMDTESMFDSSNFSFSYQLCISVLNFQSQRSVYQKGLPFKVGADGPLIIKEKCFSVM